MSPDTDQGQPALVRFSTTFGWHRLPDWVGLAVRLYDQPDGDDLDMLMISSRPPPRLWRQMRPSPDVLDCCFSSVTRVRIHDAPEVVRAVPVGPRPPAPNLAGLAQGDGPGPVRFRLAAGRHRGEWRDLGDLVLEQPRPDDPAVRFHPPRRGRLFTTALRYRLYTWLQGGPNWARN